MRSKFFWYESILSERQSQYSLSTEKCAETRLSKTALKLYEMDKNLTEDINY